MTPYHVAGAIIAILLNGGLGLALRWYAVHHWRGQRDVLYRQAGGLALITGCAALYRWVFTPPFDGLLIIPILALETLVIVLLLEREGMLKYESWNGLTAEGNLRHKKLRLLEDAMALDDEEWEHLKRLERVRMMRKLTHQALRYDGELRTRGQLEREADHIMYGEEGDRP